VRLYRGEELNGYVFDPEGLTLAEEQEKLLRESISNRRFHEVPGLCKIINRRDIENQGWSLNPGRYVELIKQDDNDPDFHRILFDLNKEFEILTSEASFLEETIKRNIAQILE
jgi:type I restriction enzyme M protein